MMPNSIDKLWEEIGKLNANSLLIAQAVSFREKSIEPTGAAATEPVQISAYSRPLEVGMRRK